MNHSLFSTRIKGKVDFLDMWRQTLEAGDDYKRERNKSDAVELEFWREFSKQFEARPNLYDYAPHIFDKLLQLVGKDKKLLEFGCGTGKFTLPMAQQAKSIVAVDQSAEMLAILEEKIAVRAVSNIEVVNSKIEDVKIAVVDSVYCINAFYRVMDPRRLFEKLIGFASDKVVIVWTMQRSIYDAILNSTKEKGIDRKQEYIYIVNILYEMGIDPSVVVETAYKNIEIETLEEHFAALKDYAEGYRLNYDDLIEQFKANLFEDAGKLYYKSKQKIAMIYFET